MNGFLFEPLPAGGFAVAATSGFYNTGDLGVAGLQVLDAAAGEILAPTYGPGILHDASVVPGNRLAALYWDRVLNQTRLLIIDTYSWLKLADYLLQPSVVSRFHHPSNVTDPRGLVLIGYTGRPTPPGTGQEWARTALVDPDTGVAWDIQTHPEGAAISRVSMVFAPEPDRYVAVVPAYQAIADGDATLWAWNLDGDGNVISKLQVLTHDGCLAVRVVYHPDFGAVGVGWCWDGVDQDALVLKLDSWGNVLWRRRFGRHGDEPAFERFLDAAFMPNGDIVFSGEENRDLEQPEIEHSNTWVVRTDPWGRTCGMDHGVCRDLTWADCEDGNPCTINWCDPLEGCTHPPTSDGSPCAVGSTCQAGQCVPTPPPQ